MEMQERSMFSQQFQMFEVWSHFASQLVFFHYLHLIDITTLLAKLKEKVKCGHEVGLQVNCESLCDVVVSLSSAKGARLAHVVSAVLL